MMLSRLGQRSALARTQAPVISAPVQQRFQGGFVPSDMPMIKRKWLSAQKVGQICTSMKNVAAGALPSVERHLGRARAYGSVMAPVFTIKEEPEDVKNVLHFIIGTDRGLCGSTSSNTARRAAADIEKLKQGGLKQKHQAFVWGSRTAEIAKTLFKEDLKFGVSDSKTKFPPFEVASHIADFLLYDYGWDWDKLIIYYNEYVNITRSELTTQVIYKQQLSDAISYWQLIWYEKESDDTLLNQNALEFKLASAIYHALAENAVSEQSARLNSMQTASKNCDEMVKEYEMIYQRLRKTKITNDLIVMGAALKLVVV